MKLHGKNKVKLFISRDQNKDKRVKRKILAKKEISKEWKRITTFI